MKPRPTLLHVITLPLMYNEASSHIVTCNNFASSIATRCAFSVGNMVSEVVAEAKDTINQVNWCSMETHM